MLRCLLLILLPLQLSAQQELDIKGVYEAALSQYIRTHPQDLAHSAGQRWLLVLQHPYLQKLPDTIDGVMVRYIDPEAGAGFLGPVFPRKQKLAILDVQQLRSKAAQFNLWIIPMKTTWKPRKRKLTDTGYREEGCEYIYDFRAEKNGSATYFFKEEKCIVLP